jgi:uncharacterized membrane protein YgcG
MTRVLLAAVVACAGFGTSRSPGQEPGGDSLAGVPLPPAPPARVLDEAGLFQRAPQRFDALSLRLRELQQAHGWSIYLAIYPSLLGMTPEHQASALQAAWNGDTADGFLIVYESDSRVAAFGRPPEVPGALEGGRLAAAPRLAAFELNDVLARAVERAAAQSEPADQVETLVGVVVDDLEAMLERKADPQRSLRRLRLALSIVGGLSAIALVALIATRIHARNERRRRRVHFLPAVHVGMRLGAPYGGGRVTARSFRAGDGGPDAGSGRPANGGAG